MQQVDEKHKRRSDIRERLLKVAGKVFAEKGCRKATIAEIYHRAGANIAAVNYYFQSKEKLYTEAWRAAFKASIITARPSDCCSIASTG